MATTVRGAVLELLEQTMATMDALLAASDRELPMASSHVCAQGKDVWTLITNEIDHEKIHTGQVLEGRYESRIPASPMERLIAESFEGGCGGERGGGRAVISGSHSTYGVREMMTSMVPRRGRLATRLGHRRHSGAMTPAAGGESMSASG